MKFKRLFAVLLLKTVFISGCTTIVTEEAVPVEIEKSQSLIIQLVSWAPMASSNEDNPLKQKIGRFREKYPNVQITIRWNDYYGTPSNWLQNAESYKLRAKSSELPDIVELVPNQMKFWHQYGIIEPLNMNESTMDGIVIKSNEGYVLGVKSKVNPLIVYYNKNTFDLLGLQPPSGEWDLSKLGDTVVELRAAGQNVFMPLTPYTLEWVTSLQGGRIVSSDGTTFAGYLDSDEAVGAAKWIAGIGTKLVDYKERPLLSGFTYNPMPYDLLEGGIALAVDFAYGFNHGGTNSYELIAQRNENIGIAALPHGTIGINPAQISGLSVTSQSTHKQLAMELLRYLTSDGDSIYPDIVTNTLENNEGNIKAPLNNERFSIVLEETKRAVPAALYLFNDLGSQQKYMWSRPKVLSTIRNGLPVQKALAEYADLLENDFRDFYNDPSSYDACIAPRFYSDSCM